LRILGSSIPASVIAARAGENLFPQNNEMDFLGLKRANP